MSEIRHTLKAYRDDSIGTIYEQDVTVLDDHQTVANEIAERFGLGAFLIASIAGRYSYEDGEILTYWGLTPLR